MADVNDEDNPTSLTLLILAFPHFHVIIILANAKSISLAMKIYISY